MVVASKKRTRVIKIGPQDHGRRMSLDDFDRAVTTDERVYELNKGIIEVSDIPDIEHTEMLQQIRDALTAYRLGNLDLVHLIAGGSEAKLLIGAEKSERHPDLSIYLRPRPIGMSQPWSVWIPEIVIEIVSSSSRKRDYDIKPDEYATLTIDEYWIIDPAKQTITIKTRWRGLWKDRVIKPGQSYATQLLPGFKLDARKILSAGK